MSRGVWNTIKGSKSFYVIVYRRAGTMIVVSLIISFLLLSAIIYRFFHLPTTDFYATSGVVPPVQLTPRDTPNYTAQALLPPDPVNEEGNKAIPQ